jgi:hypothetical protein
VVRLADLPKHPDNNAEEAAQFGHAGILLVLVAGLKEFMLPTTCDPSLDTAPGFWLNALHKSQSISPAMVVKFELKRSESYVQG